MEQYVPNSTCDSLNHLQKAKLTDEKGHVVSKFTVLREGTS